MTEIVPFELAIPQAAIDDLITVGERNNVALTQTFANSLWTDFQPFVASATGMSGDELRADPETARLQEAVLALMDNLSVIKVKVYDLEGLTVFSTEAEQMGDEKRLEQLKAEFNQFIKK